MKSFMLFNINFYLAWFFSSARVLIWAVLPFNERDLRDMLPAKISKGLNDAPATSSVC